jgi:BA14K-like protein
MSETPAERQTVIDQHRGEQIGSAETGSHALRSRSLQAGGEFVKALAADLGAAASRLRLSLAAKHRRPPPPVPPPSHVSGSGVGRVFWRVSKVLLAVLLLCSGALSAVMLWVIFGSPLEPRRSDPGATGLRAEATNDASLSRGGPVNAAEPSRSDIGPMAEAPIQPAAASTGGAAPEKPAEETKAGAQTGSNQPQPVQSAAPDPGPGAGQQEISGKLADQSPGMQCSIDVCAATYKSFSAADCTYQPYGGGPRGICELGERSAAARPQPSSVATDPSSNAPDTRQTAAEQPIAKPVAVDRSGSQCNRTLCAATYRSFNPADCTYAPYGGGPRSICELGKGPADAPPQTFHAATDSRHATPEGDEPDDMPVAGMVREVAKPALPDEAGPQCNRSHCAATYQSFNAADCTYQPQGGGPRRLCEP